MKNVTKMRKVEVQGNFLFDAFTHKQFKWITVEVPEPQREPFFKQTLDLYSYCTLHVTCKLIVDSGASDFSYDKLKNSINGMFRVLKMDVDEEADN